MYPIRPVLFALLLAHSAAASDTLTRKKDFCPPPKSTCFNVFCRYQKAVLGPFDSATGPHFKECRTASKFNKFVTYDGKEVKDISEGPQEALFEVECDDKVIFNNSAHRYTDDLGTRIQGVGGPYPAVLLPRNSLTERRQYQESTLELDGQILQGFCYVYTGPLY